MELVTRSRPHADGVLLCLRASRAALRAGLYAYLLGFWLIPALHTLDHRADHHHDAHARGTAHSHDEPPPADPTHGEGTLEHFSAALAPTVAFTYVAPIAALTSLDPAPPAPFTARPPARHLPPARAPPDPI